MKKASVACVACLLFAVSAMAQSSGNFSYGTSGASTNCVLNDGGTITGGALCSSISLNGNSYTCSSDADCSAVLAGGTCNTGTGLCTFPTPQTNCGGNFYAGIKTSSGNGNVFVIRPSLVIGLLTDVVINSKNVST